jgi:hypothetical protein
MIGRLANTGSLLFWGIVLINNCDLKTKMDEIYWCYLNITFTITEVTE